MPMEEFGEQAIRASAHDKPKVLKYYIDDIVAMRSQGNMDSFLQQLHSQQLTFIDFTIKIE